MSTKFKKVTLTETKIKSRGLSHLKEVNWFKLRRIRGKRWLRRVEVERGRVKTQRSCAPR